MKSLVVYYSHKGTTAYVARRFFEELKKKGEAYIYELKYLGPEPSLIKRFFYRFNIKAVNIITVPQDIKDYDCLYLGISVLGGYPSAAMSKYITMLENINNKKIICAYTYGLEASVENCKAYVEKLIKERGNPIIINVDIPWYNVFKENFLNGIISFVLSRL